MMQNNAFHNNSYGYAEAAVNAYHQQQQQHHLQRQQQLANNHAQVVANNVGSVPLSHHHQQPSSSGQRIQQGPPAPQQLRQAAQLPQQVQHNHSTNAPVANSTTHGSTPHPGAALPPIHLASITSLTQLLGELPLPSAMQQGGGGEALIPHAQTALYARQLLGITDPSMVATLAAALARSDTSMIALKEPYNRHPDQSADPNQLPELARAILVHNPQVFTPVSTSTSTMTNSQSQQPSPAVHTPGRRMAAGGSQEAPPSPTAAQPASDGSAMGLHQPKVLLERMDMTGSGSPETPATPSSSGTELHHQSKAESDSLRKKIVSVGKQPKAQSRKKKDMVSELFDSLTPDAKYFGDSRRRRVQPKTYNDIEYERPPISELARPSDQMSEGRVTPEGSVGGYDSSREGTSTQKKRKRKRDDSDSSSRADELERPLTPTETIRQRDQLYQELADKRREKRALRKQYKQFVEDPEELLENETFRNFCQLIDEIFDSCEEYDIAGGDEDDAIPAECLIAKSTLVKLCDYSDKMKTMQVTSRVQVDRLVKLMTILEKNVRDAIQLIMSFDAEKEGDEEDEAYRELVSERIFRSAEAALTALTIMTSYQMPKQVYIEDTIERSIQLAKNQLINVIYPAYDAQYRLDKRKEGSAKGRKKQSSMKNKPVKILYGKLVQLLECFAELVEIQPLTDTCVVQLTNLAVTPFFVEGIRDLQTKALRLATMIFKRYSKHREVILQEILGSLHRLPQSKGSRYIYKLHASSDSIQMITALIMSLVQAVVEVPSSRRQSRLDEELLDEELDPSIPPRRNKKGHTQPGLQEADETIHHSYDGSRIVANQFLSGFLSKCTAKSEDDYRRLFDGFLQDLLLAVHRPEWPAAEVMLGLLGVLLVNNFRNIKLDMTLRVASLDYLGTVAAKLRKNAVSSQLDEGTLREIVARLQDDDEEPSEDKMQMLQRALVDCLILLREQEFSIEFARQFYIAQWYKDQTEELKKLSGKGRPGAQETRTVTEQEELQRAREQCAASKQFLLTLVDREDEIEAAAAGGFGSDEYPLSEDQTLFIVKYLSSKRHFGQSFEHYLKHILQVLNEKVTAVGIRTKAMKCLALVVEADPGVLARVEVKRNVQAKLLDQASSVREAAIDLLGKFIMQKPELIEQYYQMLLQRILDTGVSVRKRVIKILKEICEKRPDFEKIPEIMTAMIKRVNDEDGIRKLVNDAFRDLWFTPCREKDTASLLKKVVNITDVVGKWRSGNGGSLDWLSALLSELLGRNTNKDCKENKERKDEEKKKASIASKQIVNCLVEHVLTLEANPEDTKSQQRLQDCLATLYLFSKVKPKLMVNHAETLEPYLKVRPAHEGQEVLVQVVQILQLVVPLMDHPSERFLNNLEDSLLVMIKQGNMKLIQDCLACIASVNKKQKRRIKRVMDHFFIYFKLLVSMKEELEANMDADVDMERKKSAVARSLFVVGVMCKYFDFDAQYPEDNRPSPTWAEKVFEILLFFAKEPTEIIKSKALGALGQFCSEHSEYLMKEDLKRIYHDALNSQRTDGRQRQQQIEVLHNIEHFLKETEAKQKIQEDAENASKKAKLEGTDKRKKEHDQRLEDMNEKDSGIASSVIQLYLREVQNCYMFCCNLNVRRAATDVTVITLAQGLVTPGTWIPSLIAMTSDPDADIRNRAAIQIKEINNKYTGFILGKAQAGIQMAFRLHKRLNVAHNQTLQQEGKPPEEVRGVRVPSHADKQKYAAHALAGPGADGGGPGTAPAPEAALSFLYSVLRDNKQNRRSFLQMMLKKFNEQQQKTCLEELLFLMDNLAHFPYTSMDEPLFVITQADAIITGIGNDAMDKFKQNLLPRYNMMGYQEGMPQPIDDDDETAEQLFIRLPSNLDPLYSCISRSLGCFLLLYLKLFLKGHYKILDNKIGMYQPTDTTKTFDRPVTRKDVHSLYTANGVKLADDLGRIFPDTVLYEMQPQVKATRNSQDGKLRLCHQYINFKLMMMTFDEGKGSEDEEEEAQASGVQPHQNHLPPQDEDMES